MLHETNQAMLQKIAHDTRQNTITGNDKFPNRYTN